MSPRTDVICTWPLMLLSPIHSSKHRRRSHLQLLILGYCFHPGPTHNSLAVLSWWQSFLGLLGRQRQFIFMPWVLSSELGEGPQRRTGEVGEIYSAAVVGRARETGDGTASPVSREICSPPDRDWTHKTSPSDTPQRRIVHSFMPRFYSCPESFQDMGKRGKRLNVTLMIRDPAQSCY